MITLNTLEAAQKSNKCISEIRYYVIKGIIDGYFCKLRRRYVINSESLHRWHLEEMERTFRQSYEMTVREAEEEESEENDEKEYTEWPGVVNYEEFTYPEPTKIASLKMWQAESIAELVPWDKLSVRESVNQTVHMLNRDWESLSKREREKTKEHLDDIICDAIQIELQYLE